MRVEDFDYKLPEESIAQHPPKVRGESKLLVLDKKSGQIEHKKYGEMIDHISAVDVVILNNTKVIKARLTVQNVMNKTRELFLLEKHGHDFGVHRHKVLHHGKIHEGEILRIEGFELVVSQVLGGGLAIIESEVDLLRLSEKFGATPLPPYVKRNPTKTDTLRYQTVFAREPGSVAAPTASLNFTEELEAKLKAKGVKIVYLTLHVGLGTFLPIRVDDVTKHKMHSEYFEIPSETVEVIKEAKQSGNKVIAVGTTVTRTLEFCANRILDEKPQDISGEADIFIYPGHHNFKVVDMLLTNFHAPRTTVLMLAAAFAGWNNLEKAYKEALAHDYNFLSYGDSMLIS